VRRAQGLGRQHPHRRVPEVLPEAVRQPASVVRCCLAADYGPRTTDMKKAIITGITGQDGSYLADWLLEKGYEVHGIVRRASTDTFDRIGHRAGRVQLHQADLLDQLSIIDVLKEVRPDEVYNLAAMSFVPTSWKQPVLTGEFTAIGVTRVLEAIRLL